MNPIVRWLNDVGGTLMARSGRVGLLATGGRRTGEARRTAVGFVERPDGRLVVAAGGPGRKWALNLSADARCTYTLRGVTRRYRATPLTGADRDAAIGELDAKFTRLDRRTPWQQVFELVPEGMADGSSPTSSEGSSRASSDGSSRASSDAS